MLRFSCAPNEPERKSAGLGVGFSVGGYQFSVIGRRWISIHPMTGSNRMNETKMPNFCFGFADNRQLKTDYHAFLVFSSTNKGMDSSLRSE